MHDTWNDFDSLMVAARAGRGAFFYLSYGRPVVIRGKALDSLRRGKSLFLLGSRFLHKQTLGFHYYRSNP